MSQFLIRLNFSRLNNKFNELQNIYVNKVQKENVD